MTRQEAFDTAARHLLNTGKPSYQVTESGAPICSYLESGCALRPFIPEGLEVEWEEHGGIEEVPEKLRPEYINEDIYFFQELQIAHDGPVNVGARNWESEWLIKMRQLATRYRLDDSILDQQQKSLTQGE